MGERLAGKGIQVVYSDGLASSVQTAQAASSYWNGEHKIEPELGKEKAMSVLESIVRQPQEQVAIVTHGDAVRRMVSIILGMKPENRRLLGKDLKNCSITELDFDRTISQFELIRFNDYAHLESYGELQGE